MRLVSPSGGGYGDPLEREVGDVATDVRDAFVSRDSAARLYGVVISDDGSVDDAATNALRSRMRAGDEEAG